MAITHVQSRGVQGLNVVPNLPLAFASNVAAGSLLVVVGITESAQGLTCTDSLGNTFTAGPSNVNANQPNIALFYSGNIPTGGANTVTLDFTGDDFCSLTIHEFSGNWAATPLHASANGALEGSTSTSPATNNVVTTVQTLVFAAMTHTFVDGTGGAIAIDGSYTLAVEDEEEANGMAYNAGYKIVNAGTYTGAWTLAEAASWACVAAAFEESVIVPPPGPSFRLRPTMRPAAFSPG
jgi:hypothetical protein